MRWTMSTSCPPCTRYYMQLQVIINDRKWFGFQENLDISAFASDCRWNLVMINIIVSTDEAYRNCSSSNPWFIRIFAVFGIEKSGPCPPFVHLWEIACFCPQACPLWWTFLFCFFCDTLKYINRTLFHCIRVVSIGLQCSLNPFMA